MKNEIKEKWFKLQSEIMTVDLGPRFHELQEEICDLEDDAALSKAEIEELETEWSRRIVDHQVTS